MELDKSCIAFIGLGEAAEGIISGWGHQRKTQIQAFDIKQKTSSEKDEITDRGKTLKILLKGSLKEMINGSDIIFSTVTANNALGVAKEASLYLKKGAFFFDLNSCAPSSKQKACEYVQAAGGRYVDVAVMAPVYPKKNLVPLLISSVWANDANSILKKLPMNSRAIKGAVGRASTVKMVRSIMVKGLEALTAECALAAVEADVLDEVFTSLSDGHPHFDIFEHSIYNLERSLTHGHRRAEELKEVSKMLKDLKLINRMSKATAIWQGKLGSLKRESSTSEIRNNFHSFAKRLSEDLRDLKDQ